MIAFWGVVHQGFTILWNVLVGIWRGKQGSPFKDFFLVQLALFGILNAHLPSVDIYIFTTQSFCC